MSKKTPKFNQPRLYEGKGISKQQYDEETKSPLPYWVKCSKCGGRPEGMNWLKPTSPDPACKVFIHIGCISADLPSLFEGQRG